MSNNQNTYIVYLYPQSTFRGELRSDTLWGIICWGIRFLYGKKELDNMLDLYVDKKFPFVISSTFPFYEEGNDKKLFFPRPYLPQKAFDKLKPLPREEAIPKMKERKETKDISYISLELLDELRKGLSSEEMQEKLKCKKGIIPSVKNDSSTHNTLNRLTSSTLQKDDKGQLFHTDEKYISGPKGAKAGLFFLVKADAENWEKVKSVLKWLEHTGIGGDKNIGKGFFKVEFEEKYDIFAEIEDSPSRAFMCLSLFMPNENDLATISSHKDDEFLNYQIAFRKGFVGNGTQNFYDKKNLAAFVEGSVFPCEMAGEIKDAGLVSKEGTEKGYTKTPYTIYQNGCAFMIPITINKD